MPDLPDPWRTRALRQLSALLDTLDRHGETLVAVHVATALACLDTRRGHPDGGPS